MLVEIDGSILRNKFQAKYCHCQNSTPQTNSQDALVFPTGIRMERSREEQEELHSEQTYNFRSSTKRKRLEHFANTTNIETYTWNRKCKVKSPISHMPTEVLQKIFTYIGFEELGSRYLIVCTLNSASVCFKQLVTH